MSLSENPHETKPLTMSDYDEEMSRLEANEHGNSGEVRMLWAEIDALRGALAEAQRERDAEVATGNMALAKLAAAQLNARTLREAARDVDSWFGTIHGWAYRTHGDSGHAISDSFLRLRNAAALSAPADEAALRSFGLQVAGAVWAQAAPSISMDASACAAIVNAVLGAPETHAKEG